jgi:hypothetical protein
MVADTRFGGRDPPERIEPLLECRPKTVREREVFGAWFLRWER